MRLQSLNCPNCGSPLRTENGMQICDSCGSTFRIDYDDSDVAYERLSKEDELNRQRYEHEKDMLETQYRLQEEARLRQAQQARRSSSAGKITAIIIIAAVATFFVIFMSAFFRTLMASRSSYDNSERRTSRTTTERTTTETTVSPYVLISASDVTADSEFVDNAVASVMSYVRADREDTVIEYQKGFTRWNMTGDAEIYACYLLTSEKENRLCFLVKITYGKEIDEDDEDTEYETKEVYDCVYLKNITVGNDGKIASNYAVRSDRGDGADDWTWMAALDSDQLYRSAILGQTGFSREKVELFTTDEELSLETEEDLGENSEKGSGEESEEE